MDWTKHLIIGLVCGIAAFYLMGSGIYETVLFGIFAAGSALLPDLDHTGSKAKEIFDKVIIFVAAAFAYFFYCSSFSCLLTENFLLRAFAFAGVYFVAFAYFKPQHRGIIHSFSVAALFAILVYFVFGLKFAIAGAVGYVSHLLADGEIKLL